MTRNVAVLFLGLFVSLACLGALAGPLIVYSANPAWVSVPGGPTTYVLPANLTGSGCGAENETLCEPTGIWYFNQTWAGIPSYISMTEATGGPSDIIMFDSRGPGGLFRVMFFSDPNIPDPSLYAGYTQYTDVLEDAVNGGVGGPYPVCCILGGNSLSVTVASDGEASFDPFGYGADTSDGIQFQGAADGGRWVPEPSTGLLVVVGGALVYVLRRRARA